MRYMLLIHTSRRRWQTLTPADKDDFLAEYLTFSEKITATGELRHTAPLADRDEARAVRVREGQVHVTPGPLGDDDTYLGGYVIVECASPERAVEIAAEVPDARLNVVEVRQIAGMGDLES